MGQLTEGEQNRLIVQFVGLVRPIAAAFYNASSPPLEEMVSEGHLGLVVSARSFDPNKSEFQSFAANGIRQHILNFIRKWNKLKLVSSLDEEKVERDWCEWEIWPHVAPFETWESLAQTPEELLARYQEISIRHGAIVSALLGFEPRERNIFSARFFGGQAIASLARQHKISYSKTVRTLDKMLRSVKQIVLKIHNEQRKAVA